MSGNSYRWLPMIKQSLIDMNCASEEELRLKLQKPANKEKLLTYIRAHQNSAPGKIPVAHVDGFDGPAKTAMSKIYLHMTVSQQFSSANRELRFADLPCLLIRMNDTALAQQLPIEYLMTRVDHSQRKLEPLPWMVTPPPAAQDMPISVKPPSVDRTEHILQAVHETRSSINGMREEMNRIADAAEIEAAFIAKNRHHLLSQIKKLEEEVKSKDGALREMKEENKHLQAALEKGTEDGYPLLSEDLVNTTVKSAINRTPSTSEFGDLLQIADDEAGNSGEAGKTTFEQAGKDIVAVDSVTILHKKGSRGEWGPKEPSRLVHPAQTGLPPPRSAFLDRILEGNFSNLQNATKTVSASSLYVFENPLATKQLHVFTFEITEVPKSRWAHHRSFFTYYHDITHFTFVDT